MSDVRTEAVITNVNLNEANLVSKLNERMNAKIINDSSVNSSLSSSCSTSSSSYSILKSANNQHQQQQQTQTHQHEQLNHTKLSNLDEKENDSGIEKDNARQTSSNILVRVAINDQNLQVN